MYCMKCGGEIPEDGQFCPVCGAGAPKRIPAAPAMHPYQPAPYQAYPPGQAPAPYPAQPGYPPYTPYQAYPPGQAPAPYPAQPGYPPAWASAPAPPYVVVRVPNPLPGKPPLGKRARDRWEIYMNQAKQHRLETGLSITAAAAVVVGVSVMMLASL